jgi:hypothetical protein
MSSMASVAMQPGLPLRHEADMHLREYVHVPETEHEREFCKISHKKDGRDRKQKR